MECSGPSHRRTTCFHLQLLDQCCVSPPLPGQAAGVCIISVGGNNNKSKCILRFMVQFYLWLSSHSRSSKYKQERKWHHDALQRCRLCPDIHFAPACSQCFWHRRRDGESITQCNRVALRSFENEDSRRDTEVKHVASKSVNYLSANSGQ